MSKKFSTRRYIWLVLLLSIFLPLSPLPGNVPAANADSTTNLTQNSAVNIPITAKLVDIEPAATEIANDPSAQIIKYRFNDVMDYAHVKLAIYFSNGFFRTFEANLAKNVKFYEKDTGTPVNLPNKVTVGMLDNGSLSSRTWADGTQRGYMEITDWYFWQIRARAPLGLNLKSQALQPNTTYVIEIGPDFELNNGLKLGKTYSFEFTTRGKDAQAITLPTKTTATTTPPKTGNGTPNDAGRLSDISGHWAEAGTKQLVAAGIMSGYQDNTFKPDNSITRAEFCTVMVKAFKLEDRTGAGVNFADTVNHWAKDSIATAAALGIVHGVDGNNFAPDAPVTREQMALMIYQAEKMFPLSGGQEYSDVARISGWAREAVNTVSAQEIMSGYPDHSFRPQALVSRAEAAAVIVKLSAQ